MAESPFSTPKRKRSEMLGDSIPKLNTTTEFTFEVYSVFDDGNVSPRTKVAHSFRGLALDGGDPSGGPRTASKDLNTTDFENQDGPRKRLRIPDIEMSDAEGLTLVAGETTMISDAQTTLSQLTEGRPRKRPQPTKSARFAPDATVIGQAEMADTATINEKTISKITVDTLSPPLSPQHNPSTSHPTHHRPRRVGTPPLAFRPPSPSPTSSSSSTCSTNNSITDPLRASLTWQENEITVYDPDDSDDDGTGINGIGFKPTPAIAYSRTMRRRQQLAEYRKREEREARAKRSARRRIMGGSPSPGPGPGVGVGVGKEREREKRKVRFLVREGRERDGVGGGEIVAG